MTTQRNGSLSRSGPVWWSWGAGPGAVFHLSAMLTSLPSPCAEDCTSLDRHAGDTWGLQKMQLEVVTSRHTCEHRRTGRALCFPQIMFCSCFLSKSPYNQNVVYCFLLLSVNLCKEAEFVIALWTFYPIQRQEGVEWPQFCYHKGTGLWISLGTISDPGNILGEQWSNRSMHKNKQCSEG